MNEDRQARVENGSAEDADHSVTQEAIDQKNQCNQSE